MHVERLVLEQETESTMHLPCVNQVIVIEDEGKGLWDSIGLIDQGCQSSLDAKWLGRLQGRQRWFAGPCVDLLQGGSDVRPKADGVVVTGVQ